MDLPPRRPTSRVVVTTDHVRTFITHSGESAAASNLIGSVEVSTTQRAGQQPDSDYLVRTAQATDFAPGDLIVVDVTAYWIMCQKD